MLKLVFTKDSAFWSASKAYTQRPTMETRVPQKADGNSSAPVLSGTGNAEISNQFVVFWLGAWNVRAWTGTGRETRPGRHRAGQFVLSGKYGRSSLGSGPPDLHYGKNGIVRGRKLQMAQNRKHYCRPVLKSCDFHFGDGHLLEQRLGHGCAWAEGQRCTVPKSHVHACFN